MNLVLRFALVLGLLGMARGAWAEPADAAAATVRKLAATLRAPKTTGKLLERTVADLAAVKPEGVAVLSDHAARECQRIGEVMAARPKTMSLDDEIAKHRETLRRLRESGTLSSEQLKNEGLPTYELLREAWEKRALAIAPWQKRRQVAHDQVERLVATLSAWEAADANAPIAEHRAAIAQLKAECADGASASAEIVSENERVARTLPADAVIGMKSLNEIRTICGLEPLRIDPKLCDAAAGHSRDMEANGFFSHQSPLTGKAAFTDRAKLAGTTASGENIFMGSSDPSEAIMGWFLSPGHHKNMLTADYTRQGLGRAGDHWTQLFGR